MYQIVFRLYSFILNTYVKCFLSNQITINIFHCEQQKVYMYWQYDLAKP